MGERLGGAGGEKGRGAVKTEGDPPEGRPIRAAMQGPGAIAHVEKTVPAQAPEGLVLRYGGFYGPGTGDFLVEAVRKRQGPGVGGRAGGWALLGMTPAPAGPVGPVGRGAPGLSNGLGGGPRPPARGRPVLAA